MALIYRLLPPEKITSTWLTLHALFFSLFFSLPPPPPPFFSSSFFSLFFFLFSSLLWLVHVWPCFCLSSKLHIGCFVVFRTFTYTNMSSNSLWSCLWSGLSLPLCLLAIRSSVLPGNCILAAWSHKLRHLNRLDYFNYGSWQNCWTDRSDVPIQDLLQLWQLTELLDWPFWCTHPRLTSIVAADRTAGLTVLMYPSKTYFSCGSW